MNLASLIVVEPASLIEIVSITNLIAHTPKLNQLAFRIGLFGLETGRLPAISKSLEIKLINQEQELVGMLKRLEIGPVELGLVRQRAATLRSLSPRQMNPRLSYNYHSLPISLALFLFDLLQTYGEPDDQELAFEACLTVLGMRAAISEAQHALLCEGLRRQRGELALTLLLANKDNEERLNRIMDRVLDRDVFVLFKRCSFLAGFSPFSPNLKKIQQQQLQDYNEVMHFRMGTHRIILIDLKIFVISPNLNSYLALILNQYYHIKITVLSYHIYCSIV